MQFDKRRDGETRARQSNPESGLYSGTFAAATATAAADDDEDQITQDEMVGVCGK